MTLQPLTFNFPLACDFTRRPLHLIAADEQLLELDREEVYRQRIYPKRIRDGSMDQAEADKHLMIWHEMILDMSPAPVGLGQDALDRHWAQWVERRQTSPVRWHHKVRELRREISMRRNVYRKQLGRGADRRELSLQMERLEAVHFTYWVRLDYLDPRRDEDDANAWRANIRRLAQNHEHMIASEVLHGNPVLAAWPYAAQVVDALHGPFPMQYGPFAWPRLDIAA